MRCGCQTAEIERWCIADGYGAGQQIEVSGVTGCLPRSKKMDETCSVEIIDGEVLVSGSVTYRQIPGPSEPDCHDFSTPCTSDEVLETGTFLSPRRSLQHGIRGHRGARGLPRVHPD